MIRYKDWTENGRKAVNVLDILIKTTLKDYKIAWLFGSKIK